MTVDFAFKRAPKVRVASVRWAGSYQEKRIRSEWENLAAWAKARGLRTGRWYFTEIEEGPRYTFEVAIEVKGPAKGDRKVHMRTYPASSIASVTFNPDQVSARVIYHGLSDWLRWQKKDKTIKGSRAWRETYSGNPWKDAKAWAKTEIQVVVSK